jgi:hypothetical protein
MAENSVSGALSCVLTGANTLSDDRIMAPDGTIEGPLSAGCTTFNRAGQPPCPGTSDRVDLLPAGRAESS